MTVYREVRFLYCGTVRREFQPLSQTVREDTVVRVDDGSDNHADVASNVRAHDGFGPAPIHLAKAPAHPASPRWPARPLSTAGGTEESRRQSLYDFLERP